MGTLDACADVWAKHCRGLAPAEAGALFALTAMACGSRVRGFARGRMEVFATAMGCCCEQANELIMSLQKKGRVRVDWLEETVTVTVWMFNAPDERCRMMHRERTRRWRSALKGGMVA